MFLTCYHWWWLAPVNLVTGVNVATMSVPPDSLEMFGKYYRPVWGGICGLLQVRARLGCFVLQRLFHCIPVYFEVFFFASSLRARAVEKS